ncbi:MAG: energy transducer TonB, partial [Candidatus Krumholzibacteria bacterium]|nr:energy transducer TonB [Candidatus Krumholzibacteria bacterium]
FHEVKELFKTRTQRIALIASVLLHLILLVVWRPLSLIDLFPDKSESKSAAASPMVFELVETPDDAIQERPEKTSLLSDKNAIARNEIRPDDTRPGEAYSEGLADRRIFAGQPEPTGNAETSSQQQVAEQPQDDSQPQLRDANPNLSIRTFDARQTLREKLYKDSFLERNQGFLSMHNRFMDDLNYNQREFSAEALGGVTLNTYSWDFAFYILEMKRKLRENTYPPMAFSRFGMISGQTVLTFRVMPDGRAVDVAVLEYDGHRTLMETSVDAVNGASPFRPLPSDFPEDYLELKWTFVYYVIH